MGFDSDFDVIVVGAGHAGIEAALAACRRGARTALITNNTDRIGFMSCNPSIGGLGKGHIVREIDALGGAMGMAADANCVQFKRLNARKGPAVRGTRVQCDKDLYSSYMSQVVKNQDGLQLVLGEVVSLAIEANQCKGVVLEDGSRITGKSVVICTGTFLNAVLHFGLKKIEGGRVGDKSSKGLSDQLDDFGFRISRLKTGTPPRLDGSSIDWSKTEAQGGDKVFHPFSIESERNLQLPQILCHLTYTNERTHEIIRNNLDKSPMFTGAIEGIGPRYCPSIEDKITRFADRDRHQTFLEPEGISSNSIYLQGISTSLPEEVQLEFLKTIPGLENVRILKPGYAVEYDFVEPDQIDLTFETKPIKGLFLAGQVNGTSGYEEAAGQGLVAGANAAGHALGLDQIILGRDQAYIGVLIDDLVNKGTKEPYRMMTSRAEHRLILREDNSLDRLLGLGVQFGLVSEKRANLASTVLEKRNQLRERLDNGILYPNKETQEKLKSIGTAVLNKPCNYSTLLRRSEVSCKDLSIFNFEVEDNDIVYEPVEISIKYEGYINRQNELIRQLKKLEEYALPVDTEYGEVVGLSSEEIEKLSKVRPLTLGQAQRISGVNPSAIQALMVYLKGRRIEAGKIDGKRSR